MTTYRLCPELMERLGKLAELPRVPRGVLPHLAERYGFARNSLTNCLSELREVRRDALALDGAEGRTADAAPARVPRGAPSAAAPGSGQDERDLDVSSQTLAPAVHDPRPVVPAAGALPLAPCEQVREAPAVPFSPGLCWARAAVAKGASVEALLRKAGDRLTWRDREALRADAHA